MVGQRFLEPLIGVRIPVGQQSHAKSNDHDASYLGEILFRHCIPAESSIQNKKTTDYLGGFFVYVCLKTSKMIL